LQDDQALQNVKGESEGRRRRVLVIAMAYPPMRGVGSLRHAGFVRYLSEFGWDPTVVTVDDTHLDAHRDSSLMRFAASDTEVVRIPAPAYYLNHQLRRFLVRAPKQRTREYAQTTDRHEGQPATAMRSSRMAGAFAALYDWMFLPKTHLPWALTVATRCVRLAARSDLIVSSAMPLGCHIAAGLLARRTHRPWIADYRDIYFVGGDSAPTRLHAWVASRLERWATLSADLVVTTTDSMGQRLVESYRLPDASRVITITNGYDREVALGRLRSAGADQRDFMRISNVGRTYGDQAFATFLQALAELIRSGKIPRDSIQFEHVGHTIANEVRRARGLGLADVCVFRGLVPQEDAFQAMLDADVLFTDAGGDVGDVCIRAKIFEYMLTGSPVLGIAADGPTRRVIEQTGIGVCAGPGDVKGTQEKILFLYDLFRQRTLKSWAEQADIRQFDRRLLTKRLAEAMNKLVEKRRGLSG
jgi:glycosyltransferase involved in cell wall biosynthesis